MPTLTPPQSATVSIPAGQVLRGTGVGTAVLGPGPVANQSFGLDADGWALGPWEWAQTVYLTATTAITYETATPATTPSAADSLSAPQVDSIKAETDILTAAVAGADSGWLLIPPFPFRLVFQLASGTTSTGFAVDISADGVTSLGQAFTGTCNTSTVAEFSPPIMFTNPQARFFRVTVTSGGPLTMARNA